MTTNVALTLPEEAEFRNGLEAITRFQHIVRNAMIEGHDYGTIPGTQKPTLLKPGAEKIAKLLGLADEYEIIDQVSDWDKPLFRYLVKCKLVSIKNGATISEGLGECNSMESRYRWRWLFESQVPADVDKSSLATKTITTRNGTAKQYRLENEDIYSQVNTVLKMAKKRALVDAALSSARLSDLFTQDMEDIAGYAPTPANEMPSERDMVSNQDQVECPEHPGEFFFKKGSMKDYAHKFGNSWHNWAPGLFFGQLSSAAAACGWTEEDDAKSNVNAMAKEAFDRTVSDLNPMQMMELLDTLHGLADSAASSEAEQEDE